MWTQIQRLKKCGSVLQYLSSVCCAVWIRIFYTESGSKAQNSLARIHRILKNGVLIGSLTLLRSCSTWSLVCCTVWIQIFISNPDPRGKKMWIWIHEPNKNGDLTGSLTLLSRGPAVPGVGSAARSGSGFWECAGQTGRPGSGARLPAPSSSFLVKGKRVENPVDSTLVLLVFV